MSIKISINGDKRQLEARLSQMSVINFRGAFAAIGEGLRTSTMDRFRLECSPEEKKWLPSIRAEKTNGLTLTNTSLLKKSIRAESSDKGVAVGTNSIRAATHQFGNTIRIKPSQTITITARPYLGISKEDMRDIKEELEHEFKGVD